MNSKSVGEKGEESSLQWMTGTWPGTLALCKTKNSSHETSDNSDTESASEGELVINDHEYFTANTQEKKKKQRNKGPYSILKEQDDFFQLRSSKLKKINFTQECCRICNKKFSTVTEANKHVRRSSCSKVKEVKQTGKNKIKCGKCNERWICVFFGLSKIILQFKLKNIYI